MMNNNTQVSLRNGANFSHIRMALKGTKIPKFKTPAGTIELWYLDRYKNNSALSGWNSSLDASHAGSTIVGAGNSSQHGKAGDLNAAWSSNLAYTANSERVGQDILYWVNEWLKQNPNATKEQIVAAYNQIAQLIRDYQQLNHTYNSTGASTNNRAFRTMFSSRSLKSDPNADMSLDLAFIGYQDKGDDIYGSSSFLRRMDLYEKEYDVLTDAEKAGRTHTIKMGDNEFLVYKKANGDIALIPEGESDIDTDLDKSTPNDDTNLDKSGFLWQPEEYDLVEKSLGKFRFPTFPLYNGALLGVANLTNKRILDTQLKAPSMRYQGWDPYAKVTDAWSTRTANKQALQEHNWGLLLSINNSNDLGRRNEMESKLREAELLTKLQNNQLQNQEFNLTSLNVQNTENLGKLINANVANQNRQAFVGEARDRLNAIAQYQALLGQNLQENIMANYTDWKAWNRNNMLQDYADWLANEGAKVLAGLQAAYDEYRNSGDITKWSGYDEMWKSNMLDNGEASNTTNLGNAYAMWLKDKPGAKAADPALQKQFLEEHEGLSFGGELDAFWKNWADYKTNALNKYATAQNKINTRWGLTKGRYNPLQFNGEVSPWLWRAMNGAPPSYQRFYKKGGRFLEYLEHNRRAEKEIRDTTMKSMQESRRMLRRDLDALDRESLLLLRAIFK